MALVLTYAPKAARRAAELGARREAAAQYERALRFVPDTDIRTRAELLDNLAKQLSFLEEWEERCSEAVALWHALGDSRRESDSLLSLAWGSWWLCRGTDFRQAAEAALKLAEPLGPSPQLAWASNTLAFRRMSEGRYEDSLSLIRQVHGMAAQLGLGDVISDCLTLEAQAVRAMSEDWTVPMTAALQVALSGGHEVRAYNAFLFMYLLYCADLRNDEAEQIFNDALAYCDLHDVGKPCLLAERSGVLEKLGRWDECASTIGAVLNERKLTRANRMQSLSILAKVMARRGQDGYWQYLDEARDSSIGLEEREWLIFVGLARVEAYWLEGRLDAARAELDRIRGASVGLAVAHRRWLALWTRRLTGVAESVDLEPFASQVAGDAARAAELWDQLGYPYEAALALLDTKEEAHLREALTRLVDLGAEAAARVVRRTMRDLGIRSIPAGARTATRAHPQGLTMREQQILQLLSEGQSNEEISAALFISVRTVEHHVSAILGKLGASTRQGAAKEARRLGLADVAYLSLEI